LSLLWLAQNSSTKASETNPDVVQIASTAVNSCAMMALVCAARELADANPPCNAECLNNNKEAAAVLAGCGSGAQRSPASGEIIE
jgi:hypothetical protein